MVQFGKVNFGRKKRFCTSQDIVRGIIPHYLSLPFSTLIFLFFSPLPNFVDPENRVYCLFGAYVTATRRPIVQKGYFSKIFRATYMGPDRSKMTFSGAKGPSLDLVDVYRPPGGKKIPKKNIFNFLEKNAKIGQNAIFYWFQGFKTPSATCIGPNRSKMTFEWAEGPSLPLVGV